MKLVLTVLTALILSTALVYSAEPLNISEAVAAIKTSSESAALYRAVKSEGEVEVVISDKEGNDFDALWDGGMRTIFINPRKVQSQARLISSIIFELHNAKSNQELIALVDKAEKGKMSKEEYVRQVEELEYRNITHAANVIESGVKKGFFPSESMLSAFNTFSDHYKLQQLYGHSQWLAEQYNHLNPPAAQEPYSGTLKASKNLSPQDKFELVRYLVMKNGLESGAFSEVTSNISRVQMELLLISKNQTDEELYRMIF